MTTLPYIYGFNLIAFIIHINNSCFIEYNAIDWNGIFIHILYVFSRNKSFRMHMISWQPNNILMNLKIMYLSSENKLLSLVIILGAIRYSLLFVTYSFQIPSKSQWIAFWKPRGFVIIALRLLLFLRKLESNYLDLILLYFSKMRGRTY